ncbi:DnaJ-like subfamily C member 14 [Cricetulus griseus]|uniref:DnaJ-like subfamily C member 14 n=1 Tax=Cricetulus griseus TaxID=10029 RepID=G3INN3_CRIGR|nr:DnaJ-like subfamily C member 14 [Cricetulus griseus]
MARVPEDELNPFRALYRALVVLHRATPETSPADLQDFLSWIFQVAHGQISNGNFFAAPHPGPGATATSKPNSTVPKGEAKPKWQKKVKRPLQR